MLLHDIIRLTAIFLSIESPAFVVIHGLLAIAISKPSSSSVSQPVLLILVWYYPETNKQ